MVLFVRQNAKSRRFFSVAKRGVLSIFDRQLTLAGFARSMLDEERSRPTADALVSAAASNAVLPCPQATSTVTRGRSHTSGTRDGAEVYGGRGGLAQPLASMFHAGDCLIFIKGFWALVTHPWVRSTRVGAQLLGLGKVVVEGVEFDEDEQAVVVSVRPRKASLMP